MRKISSPILLINYRRPECTKELISSLRSQEPGEVFYFVDGPKEGDSTEKKKVEKVRELCRDIDWDCKVNTFFADENLGCKIGVTTAVSWALSESEKIVVLEDDCIPTPQFFDFVENVFAVRSSLDNLMHISGFVPSFLESPGSAEVKLSTVPFVWGWATWRDSWKKFHQMDSALNQDREMTADLSLPSLKITHKIRKRSRLPEFVRSAVDGSIDTWDYIWAATIVQNRGYCVTPATSLVRNIGWGGSSTHTHTRPFFAPNGVDKRVPASITQESILAASHDNEMDFDVDFFVYGIKNRVLRALVRPFAPVRLFRKLIRTIFLKALAR